MRKQLRAGHALSIHCERGAGKNPARDLILPRSHSARSVMSRKSEIIPIDRRQGHTLDFEFVPRANNHDEIFVVVDGRRIASRGQPGTPEAGIWVSIVPGYTVLDKNDGEDIVVYFDGKVLQ